MSKTSTLPSKSIGCSHMKSELASLNVEPSKCGLLYFNLRINCITLVVLAMALCFLVWLSHEFYNYVHHYEVSLVYVDDDEDWKLPETVEEVVKQIVNQELEDVHVRGKGKM
uniref:Uncharacterized protein n=1 Tax=Cacopsylla melanoneura TaxID=428564 RepID=A0A8D8XG99_9HEMI